MSFTCFIGNDTEFDLCNYGVVIYQCLIPLVVDFLFFKQADIDLGLHGASSGIRGASSAEKRILSLRNWAGEYGFG